jgi:excisionase family DNA binding protein
MTDAVVARTVREFCRVYGVGKSMTYELITAGILDARKAGKRTLITEESARAWFESLSAKSLDSCVHK